VQYFYHDFAIGPEILAALPIAYRDGTLKNRFAVSDMQEKVRAKTGSMSGLNHLAGIVRGQDGEDYTFVWMMEGFTQSVSEIHQLQEKMCHIVHQYAR
jgi:D-alanyl-D-alanine carboxypeptidase